MDYNKNGIIAELTHVENKTFLGEIYVDEVTDEVIQEHQELLNAFIDKPHDYTERHEKFGTIKRYLSNQPFMQ